MAVEATDILTPTEATDALGPNGSQWATALVELYVSALSKFIDDLCGPVVARAVADLEAVTASTTLDLPAATTDTVMDTLRTGMRLGTPYSIGTVGDPAAVADGRCLTAVNYAGRTVSITGQNVTVAGTDKIMRGRYADTASVARHFKLAASMILAHNVTLESGQPSDTYDMVNLEAGFLIPLRAQNLLSAEIGPRAG